MHHPRLRRVVILGTGTGVGKTHVTCALLAELARAVTSAGTIGLKPVETGSPFADAAALDAVTGRRPEPHPLFGLADPISPHLAARRTGIEIQLGPIVDWVARQESLLTIHDYMLPYGAFSVIETAGGALSPLAVGLRNFDLARALDPAHWVLVAPDRLGVLHDLSATLIALRELGRAPDSVVLSAPPTPDASTGTNAHELELLGIATPVLSLAADQTDVSALVAAINSQRRS